MKALVDFIGVIMPLRARFLLFGLFLGVGDAAILSAQEAQGRTISLATLAPPGSTWMRVFEAWNRELRRRTERALQFRIYPGGIQGDESEVIRKIRSGRLDAASVTAVGLSQVYRPALVFQLPRILPSYEALDRAREAVAAEIEAGFVQNGFRLLGWADVGRSRVFSTQPTLTPADLTSRKPWVWRDDVIMPVFYQTIGATPVPLQVPEVLSAIQTGRVDTLITPPVPCLSLQWCARLGHMTDFPMTIVIGGTIMGQPQWASLTPEQEGVLAETAKQFHELARRNLRRDEEEAIRNLRERGMSIHSLTEAQRNEWLAVAARVRARLVGQVAEQPLIERVAAFGR
ncbi:MAG: TRAP transporter substrate-binding protein DctP [Sandaracinaceae bacterium]|nr:TRAP transporter substrate-binding protein DctP [Sandaracinaceae bacterium]MDW8245132.1 TRAP transporter substrate-binding protein DctP [Sandaracinaceae bacterium]